MSAQREKEEIVLKTVKVKARVGGSGSLPEGPGGKDRHSISI